jgi:Fe-S-cluster containining protein
MVAVGQAVLRSRPYEGKAALMISSESSPGSLRENPCLACDVNQKCCSQLSGLRLSKEEFEKYFKRHAAKLSILKFNGMFFVCTHDSRPCPHWEKGGCRIYHDRPTDCRLYPYEITKLKEKRKRIEVEFRDNLGCPQKDLLVMPVEEAKTLVEVFCDGVFGRNKPIIIKYVRTNGSHFRFFGFFSPFIARISRILRAYK